MPRKLPIEKKEDFYYVSNSAGLPSVESFTSPTVVYMFRLAYMWMNSNSLASYNFKICLDCLGDAVTLEDPDVKCPGCQGTGRIDVD